MRWIAFALALFIAPLAGCSSGSASGSGAPLEQNPFQPRSDAEVSAAVTAAKEQAHREGKRVLLEFGASWCADCREVVRVAREEPAASVLREQYVVVPIDVGRFDRNKALLREHDVKTIAALVVLDAEGKRVAKTTLEPITKKEGLSAVDLAVWLRSPRSSNGVE